MSKEDNALRNIITHAESVVTVGGFYRHYKEGEYKVLDIVLEEESLQPLVIYQAQYGDGLKFSRPLSNWLESVEHEGRTIQRFTLVE